MQHTYIDATPYTQEELTQLVNKGVDLTILDTDGFNTRYSMTDHETQEQSIIFVRKDTSAECTVDTSPEHIIDISEELPRLKKGLGYTTVTMEDTVNHPKHYTHASIECIDITSKLSFSHGNAIKYLWRCGYKGDDKENIGKALFYIDRLIKEYKASPYKTRLKRWWQLRNRDKRMHDVTRDITYGYEIRTLYNYKTVEDLRELHNRMYVLHNEYAAALLANRLKPLGEASRLF